MLCSRRYRPACTVTSCTLWIYAAFLCTCAATHPNRKCSNLCHPPIYYHTVIHCTVRLRCNSKPGNVRWLWVSISTTPTQTVFRTSSTILLSSCYEKLHFIVTPLYLKCPNDCTAQLIVTMQSVRPPNTMSILLELLLDYVTLTPFLVIPPHCKPEIQDHA